MLFVGFVRLLVVFFTIIHVIVSTCMHCFQSHVYCIIIIVKLYFKVSIDIEHIHNYYIYILYIIYICATAT